MKRSFMHIKIIAVAMLLLSACSQEDEYVAKVDNEIPSKGIELSISVADFVTDGAPDTRATDDDKTTTFDEGDRVGIIVLGEGGNLLYDNIPYVYQNNKWTFDSSNDDGKGGCYYDPKAATYIVYYPYSRAADGVRSKKGLKTIFAPKFNQSDIKDYRSSDLMVWDNSSLTPPVTTLNAKLEHAFASVYLAPKVEGKYKLEDNTLYSGSRTPDISDISDVSLTIDNAVYVPFHATDGSLRCIVPTGITPCGIRCFYTIGSKTYGNTISISDAVKTNTRYACEPTIGYVTYSLGNARVGDFYCKNNDKGYLIPGDATLTDGQKTACLGIVMKVGKDNSGDWRDDCEYKLKNSTTEMTTIHGYVLALYDGNDGNTCQWGSHGTLVNTNKEKMTGFYGYKNTQIIIDFNTGDLSTTFPATYFATEDYENKHPAPNNSSGWFLPSAGQCQYWLNNSPTLLTQVRNVTGNSGYNWLKYYFSSSESSYRPASHAWYVHFGYNIIDNLGYKFDDSYVRSCLAF